jgi:hypothetical protein
MFLVVKSLPFQVLDEAGDKDKIEKTAELIRKTLENSVRKDIDPRAEVDIDCSDSNVVWTIKVPQKGLAGLLKRFDTAFQVKADVRGGKELDDFTAQTADRQYVKAIENASKMLSLVHTIDAFCLRIVKTLENWP